MKIKRRDVTLAGIATLVGAAGALAVTGAAPIAPRDRAAMEAIVRDYILEHPEILPQAMERLQARETAKVIRANRSAIETPYKSAWQGAKDPDVILVEFFDYNCGFCRASVADVDRLLKDDLKLRVVYRELPVLGPDSEVAAHASLAVAGHNDYAGFHRALYAAGRANTATVAKLAAQYGVTAAATSQSRAEVAKNLELQNALRLSGTPSWIIGDKVLAGAVGFDALKAAIAEARAK